MEPSNSPLFRAGDEVEVRQRYTSDWSRGFEVEHDVSDEAPEVWLRRRSDGMCLPTGFAVDDVRLA
jgi:hypothetical protein